MAAVCTSVYLCVPGVCFPHGNSNTANTVRGFHVPVLRCFLQLIMETQHLRHQVHQSIDVSAHTCSYSHMNEYETELNQLGASHSTLTCGSRAVKWR